MMSTVSLKAIQEHHASHLGGDCGGCGDMDSVVSGVSDKTSTGILTYSAEERDEIQEIRNIAARETCHIRLWRVVVTLVLLLTAVVVTVVTYSFFQREQDRHLEDSFAQYSKTVADAAVDYQKDIRDTYLSFAESVTAYSESAANNTATWPFFTLPLFENYAKNVRYQSRTEFFHLAPIVNRREKNQYLNYVTARYQGWVDESYRLAQQQQQDVPPPEIDQDTYHPYMQKIVDQNLAEDTDDRDFYVASWQSSPPPRTYNAINWNFYSGPEFKNLADTLFELKNETLVSKVLNKETASDKSTAAGHSVEEEQPHSFYGVPIRETVLVVDDDGPAAAGAGAAAADDDDDAQNNNLVGMLIVGMRWDISMQNLLPQGVLGIIAVLQNSCGQSFTWQIDGPVATFRGAGDYHEPLYDAMKVIADLTSIHTHPNYTTSRGHCLYEMDIYPSSIFERSHHPSNTPVVYTIIVALTFVLVAVVFIIYDIFVRRRNEKLIQNAARSSAIVTSLFPSNVRDRLISEQKEKEAMKNQGRSKRSRSSLKAFMSSGGGQGQLGTKPLADLFVDTTVMFADIVGFTAWSSVREPASVFLMLETVFSGFDEVARARRIFKVETVGDCYVAAAGMPEPRSDHAIALTRFARNILVKMKAMVQPLEITLGPDTADLTLRIGLHSGPVTAGVLRGEKARFQLFGDTMNTCARIESTGQPGRIHVSQETADCLIHFGKAHWIEKRDAPIRAKGKGELQTYWLVDSSLDHGDNSSEPSTPTEENALHVKDAVDALDEKARRLIDWNVEMLHQLIKQIVARRNASGAADSSASPKTLEPMSHGGFPLDEVKEIITLPGFDRKAAKRQQDAKTVVLPEEVVEQLHEYVACIASMYRENPFHSFEHASHVTMSVIKLLSRIVAPTEEEFEEDDSDEALAATLHDHTYGITSDPLTQFSCAFSALIHDVDHTGVPNAQLVKEKSRIAKFYKDRSVAEQNSFALAWELLMDDCFADLRSVIFANEEEKHRFRQLVVNGVMATDIVDKELKNLRNQRWEKAFNMVDQEENSRNAVNRKATIVIEHLIQASDVAHTMQHWHIYRKWNERFFHECYKAYKMGRAEKDPSETWYKGEIGFFDFYIIPLAKKLKECGVFGKSSDEYLNYAMKNRQEWEIRGQEVLSEMMEKVSSIEIAISSNPNQAPEEEPERAPKASGKKEENNGAAEQPAKPSPKVNDGESDGKTGKLVQETPRNESDGETDKVENCEGEIQQRETESQNEGNNDRDVGHPEIETPSDDFDDEIKQLETLLKKRAQEIQRLKKSLDGFSLDEE